MALGELLHGRATLEGTARFAGRFAGRPGHFRRPDQLWLSSLGLGTRNGRAGGGDDLAYREAIYRALECGVNVFDTALSYRMQTSERTVGAALRRCVADGRIQRDEVVVVTKGGYLTVDPDRIADRRSAQSYLYQTYVDTGLVDPSRVVNGTHSLEPAFLRDQIERSRRNLGLETIDLYCVQDPELHLLGRGPTEFRELMCGVFEMLEKAVSDGSIAAYGLSTWSGLLVPYTEKGHLSIAELFELALDVGGGDHHLRCIQLPYSVGMGQAMGLSSQFDPETNPAGALEALSDTGTAVLAIAPLVQGRAASGLPVFLARALPEARTDAQRALQFVRSSPGVTSAIVGMRRRDHVEENLELTERPPATPETIESLYEGARDA